MPPRMSASLLSLTLLLAVALDGVPGHAADPSDPDWPCIQRRVPHLSLGQVWPAPPPDAAAEAHAKTPGIDTLARRLALRRTSMEEATRLIDDFAATANPGELAGLYLATFGHINHARDRILEGIGRYARKQAALDAEINQKRNELNRLSETEPPDFDAIDRAEADIDWSTRIFLDRQQSLTYVCETPVILEQRAFALGRAVAAHLPSQTPIS